MFLSVTVCTLTQFEHLCLNKGGKAPDQRREKKHHNPKGRGRNNSTQHHSEKQSMRKTTPKKEEENAAPPQKWKGMHMRLPPLFIRSCVAFPSSSSSLGWCCVPSSSFFGAVVLSLLFPFGSAVFLPRSCVLCCLLLLLHWSGAGFIPSPCKYIFNLYFWRKCISCNMK